MDGERLLSIDMIDQWLGMSKPVEGHHRIYLVRRIQAVKLQTCLSKARVPHWRSFTVLRQESGSH